jgi:hypothetical protein
MDWSRPTKILEILLTVCLLLCTAILLKRNIELQADIKRLKGPPLGSALPSLSGLSSSGEPDVVDFSTGRKRLVVVFSDSCPYSRRSYIEWQRLASFTSVQPILIDLSAATGYRSPSAVEWARIIAEPEDLARFVFRAVPQTLVVDATGKVVRMHVGELRPEEANKFLEDLREN